MNEFDASDRRKQCKPFKERVPPEWKAEDLPPLITPEGPGFMPLFSSAHWIAVRGGTCEPNPQDEEFWPRVYRELLDAICSGEMIVVGSRIGAANEPFELKPELFVGCAVQYPYPIEDFEWNFGDDELVLRSFPYDDEDDWRDEFSDALIDRKGQGWSRLMVRKSDVRRLWPFTVSSASKTGVPGRPPSIFHCENEFRRRVELLEIEDTLKAEGDYLETWFRRTHPDEKPVTSDSIQNKIRSQYREAAIKLKKARI